MWQDTVIAVGQLCFIPAMVPTLRGSEKPAVASSVMNTVIVAVIASTQATLGLWFAAATGWMIAGVWGVLAVQGFRAGSGVARGARSDLH